MAMIAVGVCGGIGAYKSVEVVRGLQKQGHDVVAVMTRAARRFVGELTFEAITRHRVLTSQFEPGANSDIEHISLASSIDLLLVAPATANVIGKFANGIADDFLTSLYLATKAPVLMAPAMNTNMLEHEAVQRNLDTLAQARHVFRRSGFRLSGVRMDWKGPACGAGRHRARRRATARAVGTVARQVGGRDRRTDARGRGPGPVHRQPFERQDGYALAAAARARGASVVLVSGPTELTPPAGVEVVRVTTAAEMRDAVVPRAAQADVVIMAAAVADYAPSGAVAQKIHKESDTLTLTLVRTPDILAELGRQRAGSDRPLLVGFAAETRRCRRRRAPQTAREGHRSRRRQRRVAE